MAIGYVAVLGYDAFGLLSLLFGAVVATIVDVGLYVFVERASLGFGRLRPMIASTYDPYFWFHERHWKLGDSPVNSCLPGRR